MTAVPAAARTARAARAGVVAALLAITALAWVWLYPMHMAPAGFGLVDAPAAEPMPWSAPKALFLFAMWGVMMAGMMIPSALAMIVAVDRMARSGAQRHPLSISAAFALAYVVVWTGFSALATGAQWAAERGGLMSMMMASANAWLSGLLLLGAGLFQFTPLKHACLARCRSPMGFLMTAWRPGVGGAARTGLRHGMYCVGCCWAMMGLLFVFGTMNLVAAAGLAVLVLAEKALPGGAVIARVAGMLLIVAGVVLLARAAG
jgi:predicted metal-binding membrane protein